VAQDTRCSSIPAFDVRPHVIDPTGVIAIWWTEPKGALLQLGQPTRGTAAMAEWLVGPCLELLMQRYPGRADLRLILDMREMTGRSAMARSLLIQYGKLLHERLAHVVIVPSVHLGAAYVTMVEATAAMLRLAGLNVDVERSLERVLYTHGVRAAIDPPGGPSPAGPRAEPAGPRQHPRHEPS
jgi:hypothetical protein